LIENGAEVDKKDKDGETPLVKAVHESCIDIIQILIESKASLDAKDKNNKSLMDIALENKSIAAVLMLADAGAPDAYKLNDYEFNDKETIKEGNKESVYTRENFIDDLLGEFKTDADLRSVTKTWLQKKKVITEKSMQISKAEIQGHNKSEMYAAIMAAADKGWAQLYSRKDKQSKGTSTSLPAGKPWLDPATIAAAKASAERLKKLENRSEGVTQF
jgi:ankyrin repeat protein